MTMYLAISDGTTTVTLTTAGRSWPLSYVPRRGAPGAESVTETIEVFWHDEAYATSDAATLRKLFRAAERWHKRRVGLPVTLRFKYDTTIVTTARQSIIMAAVIDWAGDGLNEQYGEGYLEARITVTREPWWEGDRTAIPLTNMHDTDTTAGLTVDNGDDASYDNWFDIDGDDILGDFPTPLEIKILPAATVQIGRIFMGHNVWSNPSTFKHILEAEDGNTGGTDTVSASSSGGYYNARSFSTEANLYVWSLTSAQMALYAQNRFRVLGVSASGATSPTGAFHMQVRLEDGLGNTLATGPWVYQAANKGVIDLGVVQLPPYYLEDLTPGAMSVAIYAYSDDGGSETINMDYFELLCLDSYRRLDGLGTFTLSNPSYLVDDGPRDTVYVVDSTPASIKGFVAFGGPIMAEPGRDQRVFINHSLKTSGGVIASTMTVQAWYRPRYESF